MMNSFYRMTILIHLIISAAIGLTSCGESKGTPVNTTNSSDSLALVTELVNGVTPANSGMKKGPVELKGTIAQPKAGKLYLWETLGKNTNKIDSTSISNGTFTFGTKEFESGVYMIGINDNNMCPVIVNPSESICEIAFTSGKFESSLKAVNSKENEGWAQYMPQETMLLKQIKDARVAGHKNKTMKAEYDKQAAAKETELLNLQKSLIEKYPNTFLAKILTWKQEPDKSDKGKYWDNVDFTDESIMRSKVLPDRIESYMRTFSGGKDDGFYSCIDLLVTKAKGNDRVLEFTLNQMLTGFYESGLENICAYIADNYIFGDSCGDADFSAVIKSTAESIQNLGVGKTPPNISMSAMSGSNFDLYQACAKNKYTLVMFWSSWCEHCKGEAPEVKACYDQWHTKGFEMVGVSIDNNKGAWEMAVNDRAFTFPNVCGMNLFNSKVAKDYRVSRTPAFFLLDSSNKIVLKPKGIREVQQFLAANIK